MTPKRIWFQSLDNKTSLSFFEYHLLIPYLIRGYYQNKFLSTKTFSSNHAPFINILFDFEKNSNNIKGDEIRIWHISTKLLIDDLLKDCYNEPDTVTLKKFKSDFYPIIYCNKVYHLNYIGDLVGCCLFALITFYNFIENSKTTEIDISLYFEF